MGKGRPYSIDLRDRVVAAVERDGLSCHRAAAQFGVSVSSAIKWVRRRRETGSVAPGKMGGHRPKLIAGKHRTWLLARITARDFTLRGLVAELVERGLKVDYRTVWSFVQLLSRSHPNIVVVALAAKLARIVWDVLRHETQFEQETVALA
jgi:putative transposase